MNGIVLNWENGSPTKPGKYLFRYPNYPDLKMPELVYALAEPTSYKWVVVDVKLDEQNNWLVFDDEEGQSRVVNVLGRLDESFNTARWYAELP